MAWEGAEPSPSSTTSFASCEHYRSLEKPCRLAVPLCKYLDAFMLTLRCVLTKLLSVLMWTCLLFGQNLPLFALRSLHARPSWHFKHRWCCRRYGGVEQISIMQGPEREEAADPGGAQPGAGGQRSLHPAVWRHAHQRAAARGRPARPGASHQGVSSTFAMTCIPP